MTILPDYPGFLANLFTFGIARARWVSSTNQTLGQGGAGALFAWFLAPFANYGVAGRMNDALRGMGSGRSESPIVCFFLTGWPFIGSKKRLTRLTEWYNDAQRVQTSAS